MTEPIDVKIFELSQQQLETNQELNRLRQEKNKNRVDEFKKLEWMKDTEAILKMTGFHCAGLPAYRILMPSLKNNPLTNCEDKYITVWGESKQYEYNIVYDYMSYETEWPNFFTSEPKSLIKFLDQYKFKKLSYDETSFAILLAAKDHNQFDIEKEFQQNFAKWDEETVYLSDLREIAMHPSYQRIIGMGTPVVPLILKELQKEPNHWFWALTAITGENPVNDYNHNTQKHIAGNVSLMSQIWINWGKSKGYIT